MLRFSHTASFRLLAIQIIRPFQPLLDFAIDLFDRTKRDAMGDAIFLGEAARVDEAAFHGTIL